MERLIVELNKKKFAQRREIKTNNVVSR